MTSALARRADSAARTIEVKRVAVKPAEVSLSGEFEGYASLFNMVDLGGDVVERGAFRDTLAARGAANIKMLWQHDQSEPIGTWLSMREDSRGLLVRGKLDLAVARAREALALLKSGALDGLSIGFRTEKATKDAATGHRLLRKIDLWEISLVTFPMAPRARVTSVKAALTRADLIAPGGGGGGGRAAGQADGSGDGASGETPASTPPRQRCPLRGRTPITTSRVGHRFRRGKRPRPAMSWRNKSHIRTRAAML